MNYNRLFEIEPKLDLTQLSWIKLQIANFQKISWYDFLGLNCEIFLCTGILIGFLLIGFIKLEQTPKDDFPLGDFGFYCQMILMMTVSIYSLQLDFLGLKSQILFNGYGITDFYSIIMKIVVNLTVVFILNLANDYLNNHPWRLIEYPVLFILLAFFLNILLSAYNLMTAFLAIVGFSLVLYILLLYDSFNQSSREAGIKYFYLSTFSSGLIISGIFLAYFIFHNVNFLFMTWQLHNWVWYDNIVSKLFLFHFMLYSIIFGFLFKLAAFPCHLWAPEIYDGSPHPITALFVLPVKIATLSFFLRLLNYTFSDLYQSWNYIIWFSAVFSMIWGCLGALNESRIKRFIAYSSINQMGFLFIGLVCGTFDSLRATLIYLFLYVIMNLGFFILFLTTREQITHRALTYLTDFNDYAQKNYFYTVTFVIILFSMAGIPPLGGFFGKYYLFLHAFETGHFTLVIIGMITSVIATYYYLRIIKIMWFEKPILDRFVFKTKIIALDFGLYIGIECILILFVIWSPWIFMWSNMLVSVAINPLTAI